MSNFFYIQSVYFQRGTSFISHALKLLASPIFPLLSLFFFQFNPQPDQFFHFFHYFFFSIQPIARPIFSLFSLFFNSTHSQTHFFTFFTFFFHFFSTIFYTYYIFYTQYIAYAFHIPYSWYILLNYSQHIYQSFFVNIFITKNYIYEK